MNLVITEELVKKYIDKYFKTRYPIHPDFKDFWDLVIQVVIDENAEIVIEDDRRGYFIRYQVGSIDHYTIECKEAKSTKEFIQFVAKNIKDVIYQYEGNVITLTGVEYFLYEEYLKNKKK